MCVGQPSLPAPLLRGLCNLHCNQPAVSASHLFLLPCCVVFAICTVISALVFAALQLADEVTGGKPETVLGYIMDNTKANRNAMILLEERDPQKMAFGCHAHGFNLLFKDWGHIKNKTGQPQKCKCVGWAGLG